MQRKLKADQNKENAIINIKKLHLPTSGKVSKGKIDLNTCDWGKTIQGAKEEDEASHEDALPDDGSYTPEQIKEVDEKIRA